jgi:hypothetical protein
MRSITVLLITRYYIKSWRMRWVGHVACTREERKVYKVLGQRPEGNRPLGKLRHRWEDGIRRDLADIGRGWRWIHLAQRRGQWRALVNVAMNL